MHFSMAKACTKTVRNGTVVPGSVAKRRANLADKKAPSTGRKTTRKDCGETGEGGKRERGGEGCGKGKGELAADI